MAAALEHSDMRHYLKGLILFVELRRSLGLGLRVYYCHGLAVALHKCLCTLQLTFYFGLKIIVQAMIRSAMAPFTYTYLAD